MASVNGEVISGQVLTTDTNNVTSTMDDDKMQIDHDQEPPEEGSPGEGDGDMNETSDGSLNSITSNNNDAKLINAEVPEMKPETPDPEKIKSEEKLSEPEPEPRSNSNSLPRVSPTPPVFENRKVKSEPQDSPESASMLQNNGDQDQDEGEYEKFASNFDKEQSKLHTLMLLKEREWTAILKLKKLKELKLCRLQREQQIQEQLQYEVEHPYKAKLLSAMYDSVIEIDPSDKYLVDSRKYILKIEREIDELTKEVMTEHTKQPIKLKAYSQPETQGEAFLASNALKSLVTRCRTVPDAPSLKRGVGAMQGLPMVDVTSIIDARTADGGSQQPPTKKLKLKPKHFQPSPHSSSSSYNYMPMKQPASVSFSDMLSKISAISEKEKVELATQSTPVMTMTPAASTSTKKAAPPPTFEISPGEVAYPSAKGMLGAGKPVGTTLAKLLSTNINNLNNPTTANRVAEEFYKSTTTTANSSSGSEKNLSLANLLASAKNRDQHHNNMVLQRLQKEKEKAELKEREKRENASPPTGAPVCQGCNLNLAQFVCAGCSQQWYCSRECQVSAWDEHAEVCGG